HADAVPAQLDDVEGPVPALRHVDRLEELHGGGRAVGVSGGGPRLGNDGVRGRDEAPDAVVLEVGDEDVPVRQDVDAGDAAELRLQERVTVAQAPAAGARDRHDHAVHD